MEKKAQIPEKKDFSRQKDESIADYVCRIGRIIHQPTKEMARELDERHQKKLEVARSLVRIDK